MLQDANIIFRCQDEWGSLNVHEAAGRRYLSFGNEVEQSCIDIHQPARLCYQYTQVMMLGSLFAPPDQQITLLGLGAGSLVQALLTVLPDCHIVAVEQRRRVVELAREWLYLPRDKRLRVRVGGAYDYLQDKPKPADLILADLFRGEGMDDLQAQQGFLTSCRMALRPGGLLVANYWLGDALTAMAMNQTLQAAFNHPPVSMTTAEGNCIAFAFDGGPPRIDKQHFPQRAGELGDILDIPLQRHATALLQQNRMTFKFERKKHEQ